MRKKYIIHYLRIEIMDITRQLKIESINKWYKEKLKKQKIQLFKKMILLQIKN